MVTSWAIAAISMAGGPATVSRAEVFPVEQLPAAQRVEAEATLLKAMDREALYTIIGGLKPMSSGWISFRQSVSKPDLARITQTRQMLSCFRVGRQVEAYLQPFWRVYGEDERYLDGVIFHRGSTDAAIRRNSALFGWFGVTEGSHPLEAVMAIDRDDTPRRNRAYGYLFGYPDYAVDFFTDSEEVTRRTKKFVPRDFRSIPTFERETNAFVYAVPKGDPERPEDVQLRSRALPILRKYRELRAKYIGEGKPGIVQLIRDWMDDGTGKCSPEIAEAKCR